MNRTLLRSVALTFMTILILFSAGCGKKADPRPPATSLQGEQACEAASISHFGGTGGCVPELRSCVIAEEKNHALF